MKKVNIIMATYNGRLYVKEQIESILRSTYQNFVITVCDDGSTDGTINILEQMSKEYPEKIHLCQNSENKGVIRNFLETAYEMKDGYVMFCDQDDVWEETKIEKSVERICKMEKRYGTDVPVAVYADACVVNQDLDVIAPSFHGQSKLNTKKIDFDHLLMENKLLGCTIIFNQALNQKLDYIPQHARMHDWWVGLIATSFGRVSYISEPLLLYRQHETNVVGNQSFQSYVMNRIASLNKQKKVIQDTIMQGQEFYKVFYDDMGVSQRKTLRAFASLNQKNWFQRRKIIIQHGFLKSGFIRNIGLLLVI